MRRVLAAPLLWWLPLWLLLCLLPTAAHALGREISFDELVAHHPNQVTAVLSCGSWQVNGTSGGASGFYRITHASLNGQSLLYAQWMSTDADGRNMPRFTLSVPELNNDHAEIELGEVRCSATAGGVRIQAPAHFGHEMKDGRIEVILLHAPGRYRFQRQPR